MQSQATASNGGIVVAYGYGLKLYVERGHLIVHHGVGRDRETLRLNRATSKLKRLIVVGHAGFITLEALRWVRDVGATFAQIDSDGTIVALSAAARHHESKLRRAQVLATTSDIGRAAVVELLRAKLERQAEIAERLAHLKPTVRVKDATPIAVAAAIRESAAAMHPDLSFAELRQLESAAGRNYWQTWARVPVRFASSCRRAIPEHWHTAGPRTSAAEEKKRARKATTPVHAILNYAYAILETEATIAAHKLGFDPSLGLMHADRRYRGSLATDLMEPVRPVADAHVLDLIQARELARGDVIETREGVCRVGPPMARRLASFGPELRLALAPHAEDLARALLRDPNAATPLTRSRHRAALLAR